MRFEYNNTNYSLGFVYRGTETIVQLRSDDAHMAYGVARLHPGDHCNRVIGRVIALRDLNAKLKRDHNSELDRVGRAVMWNTVRGFGVRGIR